MRSKRKRRRRAEAGGHLVVVAPRGEADFIASTPVLEAAVMAPAWSEVTLLVSEEWAPALAGGPCENQLQASRALPRTAELLALEADAALLLDGTWRVAWRARRAGIALRVGAGNALMRSLCTHSIVPASSGGHRLLLPSATLYRDLGGLAGVWARDLRPRLGVPAEAAESADLFLGSLGRPIALIDPYPDYGEAGAWAVERFAALTERLERELGLASVLAVDGSEPEFAREIAEAPGSLARVPPEDLWTSGGRAALTQRAELCVVSSGAARLAAAAFGRACVHLAGPGPTAPAIAGADEASTVRVHGLECSPCLATRCALADHPCMRELGEDAVLSSVQNLLRSRLARGGRSA